MYIQMIYYTYMVLCKNGNYYVGQTNNYKRRMSEHERGSGALYVKLNGFDKLVYLEYLETRSDAMRRERELKKLSKADKKDLIEKCGCDRFG